MFPLKPPGIKGSLKPKTLRVSWRIIHPYPPNSATTTILYPLSIDPIYTPPLKLFPVPTLKKLSAHGGWDQSGSGDLHL